MSDSSGGGLTEGLVNGEAAKSGGGDSTGDDKGPGAAGGGAAWEQLIGVPLLETSLFRTPFIPWHLNECSAMQILGLTS